MQSPKIKPLQTPTHAGVHYDGTTKDGNQKYLIITADGSGITHASLEAFYKFKQFTESPQCLAVFLKLYFHHVNELDGSFTPEEKEELHLLFMFLSDLNLNDAKSCKEDLEELRKDYELLKNDEE